VGGALACGRPQRQVDGSAGRQINRMTVRCARLLELNRKRLRLRKQRLDLHQLELRARANLEASFENAKGLLARSKGAVRDREPAVQLTLEQPCVGDLSDEAHHKRAPR